MAQTHFVFDIGNVLFAVQLERFWQGVSETTNLTPDEIRQRYLEVEPLVYDYESGTLSGEEFFGRAASGLQFSAGKVALRRLWQEIFEPIPGRAAIVAELAKSPTSGPLTLLSNTNESHIGWLEDQYPDVFQHFPNRVYSHEVGAMKPDSPIYEAVERVTGVPPGSHVFFDDKLENVEAARARGWTAHQLVADDDLNALLA